MFHFAFVGVCSQKELGGGGSVLDQSVSKNRVRSFLRGPQLPTILSISTLGTPSVCFANLLLLKCAIHLCLHCHNW